MIRCEDCGRGTLTSMESVALDVRICVECWRQRIEQELADRQRLRDAFNGTNGKG